MTQQNKMPLKFFWESVEQRLMSRTADELRAILRAMAQETPPSGRRLFLQKLNPPQDPAITADQLIQQADLLADIDDLTAELQDKMGNAEYWEEHYGWDDVYYDEDSLGPYEHMVEPLSDLFDRTAAAFDYGELELARTAYQKLFEVLSLEDDYGRGIRSSDLTGVDMNEADARYLRAVYELEPLERRPEILFEQMSSGIITHSRPMLNELIQISPQPLPEQAEFLPAWITFLRSQSGGMADSWLREAIWLSQGTAGLETLARTEGRERPRAYLDWFTALAEEGKHEAILQAAQEALQRLPADLPIRAAVADHLCEAAARLDRPEAVRAGRWEAFLAKPTLERLLDVWEAAPGNEERRQLMRQAAEHIQDYLGRSSRHQGPVFLAPGIDRLEQAATINKSVLAHAWLLAGEVETVHQLVIDEKVLGWSNRSSSQSLVIAAFLVLLSGKTIEKLPPNLGQLWRSNLQSAIGIWRITTGAIDERLDIVYAELFKQPLLSRDQQERFLAWCLDVSRRRAEAIVSNKYRKSYDKAANVTVACAEMLRLRGEPGEADRFVDDIRTRFPRHRAFQAELKAALKKKT